MSSQQRLEFLELPVRTARGPQTPLASGFCTYCGGEVLVVAGSFKAHNWGMRLCPGSWQGPAAGSAERAEFDFVVR